MDDVQGLQEPELSAAFFSDYEHRKARGALTRQLASPLGPEVRAKQSG